MAPCDPTSTFANDVWFKFTTGSIGGSVTVSANTTTTLTDVVLSVFDGTCGALNILTPTASSGTGSCIDGPAAGNEFGTYTVAANTTYYVRIYGYVGAQGAFPIQATGAPLAIKLANITATNVGSRNRIDWTTVSETAGDHFELERSTDGRNYTTITTITAKGEAATYSYWDATPEAGINYYRLYMKDAQGNGTYSREVTAVVKGNNAFGVTAHPNPVSDKLQVSINGTQGKNPVIVMTDITGKLLQTVNVTGNSVEVDMSRLAAGIYMIKYSDASRSQTIKVNKR
jgi:hypothetical protein